MATTWHSPTGHNDPDGQWTNEANAYDDDTTTFAETPLSPAWGSFLELTTPALLCDKVRYWLLTFNGVHSSQMDLDIFYGAAWHDLFEGNLTGILNYIEKSFVGQSITKARIRCRSTAGAPTITKLYEFDFGESLMEYTDIRTAIKTALDGISGLNNHKEEPDAIPKLPFSILGNGEIDYSTDMGGGHDLSFRLFLAVHEPTSQDAFSSLDDYLASTGSSSVKAAIEAASIGHGYARVRRVENVGHVRYRERTFVGAEFLISVESGG